MSATCVELTVLPTGTNEEPSLVRVSTQQGRNYRFAPRGQAGAARLLQTMRHGVDLLCACRFIEILESPIITVPVSCKRNVTTQAGASFMPPSARLAYGPKTNGSPSMSFAFCRDVTIRARPKSATGVFADPIFPCFPAPPFRHSAWGAEPVRCLLVEGYSVKVSPLEWWMVIGLVRYIFLWRAMASRV